MPDYAVNGGARLVIINLSETPMDKQADIVLKAKAGEAMSRILQKVTDRI